MRGLDLSSWHSLVATLTGLVLVTLMGVGIRLLMMVTIQQRRERMNRQINERLRTLIAAYKTLGGSFTGDLEVNPAHLKDLRKAPPVDLSVAGDGERSDRSRRIRDAVEAALSDIILLGTEPQAALAAQAARELVAGHPVHTHELVVSLRDFIRAALDLDPLPAGLVIPLQGPARPSPGGKGGKGEGEKGGGRQGGGGGGGGMGGMGGGMGGGGMGGGSGSGSGGATFDDDDPHHPHG